MDDRYMSFIYLERKDATYEYFHGYYSWLRLEIITDRKSAN